MTGCVAGDSAELLRQLDETVERLGPALRSVLERLGVGEVLAVPQDDGTQQFDVPVRFPDGIGAGRLVARLFRYRTGVRVDVSLMHNRVIALADGRPTDRACFLNDYSASVTVGADQVDLPERFVTEVRNGVPAALAAVESHNRRHPQPWSRIRVAAG